MQTQPLDLTLFELDLLLSCLLQGQRSDASDALAEKIRGAQNNLCVANTVRDRLR